MIVAAFGIGQSTRVVRWWKELPPATQTVFAEPGVLSSDDTRSLQIWFNSEVQSKDISTRKHGEEKDNYILLFYIYEDKKNTNRLVKCRFNKETALGYIHKNHLEEISIKENRCLELIP